MGQVVGRDPLAAVRDRDQDVGRPAFGPDRHPAAAGRVAGRVLEQVAQDLGQRVRIGPGRQPVRQLDLEGEAGSLDAGRRQFHGSSHGDHDVDLGRRGHAFAGIALGQRVERGGQPDEPLGLVPE